MAGASEAFFGRATDDTVCRAMGILKDLLQGEAVEADRGFHEMIADFSRELKGFLTPATLKRGRPSKTDKDRRADCDYGDKVFSAQDSIRTARLAHRRIVVEHWNAVIEMWKLGKAVPHDMSHMVTYIQWAIMFLAVLHDPPHPVTEGSMRETVEEELESSDTEIET